MSAPSITCVSCGRTSHSPDDVAARYCGNCHADAHGSIVWTASEQDPKIITGSVGTAPFFRISPSARPHHVQLGVAPLLSVIYEADGHFDIVPHALDTVGRAKDTAAILMARLLRLVFYSSPSLGLGNEPVAEAQLVPTSRGPEGEAAEERIRQALKSFDEGLINLRGFVAVVDEIKNGFSSEDVLALESGAAE